VLTLAAVAICAALAVKQERLARLPAAAGL
jgi:hypothetical protein